APVKVAVPAPEKQSVSAATITVPATNTISPPAATTPAQEETKQPTAPAKKPLLKTSSPRIQGFINPEQKSAEKELASTPLADLPRKPYTEFQIENAWQIYAGIQKTNNKPNYAVTLSSRKPRLGENNMIEFTVDNASQAEFLQNDKQELLSFLRKELSNYDLQINILVNKIEGERKLYTAQDKFKHMAEKNPALAKLRQQFDLDVDF
ncbi:MAG TPA: hypothetical protein VNZ86_09660, partial [Bacteroidia bacterium]|nr:hypothetical protein [Bacteroidia bacterium]